MEKPSHRRVSTFEQFCTAPEVVEEASPFFGVAKSHRRYTLSDTLTRKKANRKSFGDRYLHDPLPSFSHPDASHHVVSGPCEASIDKTSCIGDRTNRLINVIPRVRKSTNTCTEVLDTTATYFVLFFPLALSLIVLFFLQFALSADSSMHTSLPSDSCIEGVCVMVMPPSVYVFHSLRISLLLSPHTAGSHRKLVWNDIEDLSVVGSMLTTSRRRKGLLRGQEAGLRLIAQSEISASSGGDGDGDGVQEGTVVIRVVPLTQNSSSHIPTDPSFFETTFDVGPSDFVADTHLLSSERKSHQHHWLHHQLHQWSINVEALAVSDKEYVNYAVVTQFCPVNSSGCIVGGKEKAVSSVAAIELSNSPVAILSTTVTYPSEILEITKTVISLLFSYTTLYLLVLYIMRVRGFILVVEERNKGFREKLDLQGFTGQESNVEFLPIVRTIDSLLPEQIYVPVLLFFLIGWQGFAESNMILWMELQKLITSSHSSISDDSQAAMFFKCYQSLCLFGVLGLLWILVDGLQYFPSSNRVKRPRLKNPFLDMPKDTVSGGGSPEYAPTAWTMSPPSERKSLLSTSKKHAKYLQSIFHFGSGGSFSSPATTSAVSYGSIPMSNSNDNEGHHGSPGQDVPVISDHNECYRLKSYLGSNHPSSPHLMEFLGIKLGLLCVSWLLLGLYWYAAKNYVDKLDNVGIGLDVQWVLMLTSEWLLCLLVIIWATIIVQAMRQTKAYLCLRNYLSSRFNQIVFRIILFQVFTAVLLVIAATTMDLALNDIVSVNFAVFHEELTVTECMHFVEVLFGLVHTRYLSCWVSGSVPPPVGLAFVSAMIYGLVFVTLPLPNELCDAGNPTSTSHDVNEESRDIPLVSNTPNAVMHSYVSLYDNPSWPPSIESVKSTKSSASQSKRQSISTLSDTGTVAGEGSKPELFCVEMACQLLECSWQSYFLSVPPEPGPQISYNPVITTSSLLEVDAIGDDFTEKHKIDLFSLGYNLVCECHNVETDSSGFVATPSYFTGAELSDNANAFRYKDMVIVSFRGTNGITNVATDLKFAQCPLPVLALNKEQFGQNVLALCKRYMTSDRSAAGMNCDVSEPIVEDGDDNPWSWAHLQESFTSQVLSLGVTPSTINPALPRIHKGFWEAYAAIRHQVLAGVVDALVSGIDSQIRQLQQLDPNECMPHFQPLRIYVCGHSLGGAIAAFASLDLVHNIHHIARAVAGLIVGKANPFAFSTTASGKMRSSKLEKRIKSAIVRSSIVVYTFGSPRIGNAAFAALSNKLLPHYYRVVLDGDLVPMIPKLFGWWKHAGVCILIDADEQGSLIINPSSIETQLLRMSTGIPANHVLSKYRDSLYECFTTEEKREYVAQEFYRTSCASEVQLSPVVSTVNLQHQMQPLRIDTFSPLSRSHSRKSSFREGDKPLPSWLMNY